MNNTMSQKIIEKKFEMSGSNADGETYTISTSIVEVNNQKPSNSITVEIQ